MSVVRKLWPDYNEGTVSSLSGTLNVRINYAIALELRDRVVGSGPAQQAMLSEGSDLANPPKQTFKLIFFLMFPIKPVNLGQRSQTVT